MHVSKRMSEILAMIVCALFLTGCDSSQQNPDVEKRLRPLKVVTVKQEQSFRQLTFPARLQPVERAKLAFRVPGTVIEIPVIEGQKIKEGDLIARMDPHDFNVMVREWEARYQEATTVLEQAKSEHRRVVLASENDAIAVVDLDRASTGVERAKAGVKVASQRLRSARDALAYSQLTAPFDGVVARIKLEPFEQAMPGISVVTLYGEQGYEVTFDAPDTLAEKIKAGQSGSISFNSEENKTYPVVVREVARASSLLAKTFQVTASLTELPAYAWPDMIGEISLNVSKDSRENKGLRNASVQLPSSAVAGRGNDAYVMVIENNRARQQSVTVTGFEGESIRVKGNLEPGSVVVVSGVSFLENGQPVGVLINHADRAQL